MVEFIKKIMKNKFNRDMEDNDIDLKELKKLQREGAVLIDVRSPQEFNEGHLDGAICIPEYRIKKEMEEMFINKEEKYILYCSSGARSKKAQKTIKKLGYKNVYNLYNGYVNY